MTANTVDALVLRLNQVRDNESLPEARRLEAEHLVAEFQQGVVSEDVFTTEAGHFLGITRADAGSALGRSFAVRIHEARPSDTSNLISAQQRLVDKLVAAAPFCNDLDGRGRVMTGLGSVVQDICNEFNAGRA